MNEETRESGWLLRVRDLSRIYGDPVADSVERTGPSRESNVCPISGAVVALAGVSFDVYPGEVLGIVGESGSGKSTLLQILYFDHEASGGAAFFKPVDN